MGCGNLKNMLDDVIILAKGESRRLCPFDADEIWGTTNVGSLPEFQNKRIDKVFAFDPLPTGYLEEMRAVAPIVSWQPYADIEYPLDDIIAKFHTCYFTNSVCYMIAYAMFCEIPLIRLYGVDASYGGIYALERSGIEYWIGRAQERGIEFQVSQGSHLLKNLTGKMYGKEHDENTLLYFSERLQLLNLLPRKGGYDEIAGINLARWILSVKEDEGKRHGVTITKNADGSISFSYPSEFATEVWLPQAIRDYLASMLKGIEASGELPVDALSVYEKLVLGDSPGDK